MRKVKELGQGSEGSPEVVQPIAEGLEFGLGGEQPVLPAPSSADVDWTVVSPRLPARRKKKRGGIGDGTRVR